VVGEKMHIGRSRYVTNDLPLPKIHRNATSSEFFSNDCGRDYIPGTTL